MGRPEVTQPPIHNTLERGIHTGLPLKITGIVFWGLVAIGLVLIVETIHWLQLDLEKAQLEQSKQVSLMVNVLLQQTRLAAIGTLEPQLDMLVHSTDIVGIRVHSGLNSISAGESGAHLTLYTNNFTVDKASGNPTDIVTYVWMMPIDKTLAPQKKRLIIERGGENGRRKEGKGGRR